MKDVEGVVARIIAWDRGRAVPIRETSAIEPDPTDAVGIATISVVTEDQVQALAFGSLGSQPTIVARIHPLGRDTADLEPFATWLVDHVRRVIGRGDGLRIWVPHIKTIETLEILGRRYERNQNASATLQEAARYCRIISEQTRYAGQQAVAVALDLLLSHLVTGQMPIEDQHLGAVLAWVDPEQGRHPREVAAERSRWPASGILINSPDRDDDDRIEKLRKGIKTAPARRRAGMEREIRDLLIAGVQREWELLCRARSAFWRIGLTPSNLAELAKTSRERVSWAVQNFLPTPTRAIPITRKLEEHEDALQRAEDAAVRSDGILRRKAARLGHLIEGVVARINQPRRNFHPCEIVLQTTQTNLRVRLDDRIELIGGSVRGVVRGIQPAPTGATEVRIEVTKGVRGANALVGATQEWVESRDFPLIIRSRALSEAQARTNWMVEGAPPPAAQQSTVRHGDLLDLANAARRQP